MQIKSILAFRNDRFGEFLLTIPAFWMLKQNYPEVKINLVVNKDVLPLARRIPFVDRLIVWENRKHTFGEALKFSKELRRGRYDLSVIFNPSKEFNIVSFLAGIPIRAGYDRKWGFLLNRKIKDAKEQGLRHEVDYNLELLKAVSNLHLRGAVFCSSEAKDLGNNGFPLEIKQSDFPDNRLAELGISDSNFITIHPWSSNPEKELAMGKFRDLCARLPRETACRLVLIGGREEAARSGEFSQGLPVINLTGKTSLIELAGLLKRSRLLVTVDSGPMHLAAAVGTPVVAIFRKNPPAVSAVRWGPVGAQHIIIENDSIENVNLNEVLNAIRKALSG